MMKKTILILIVALMCGQTAFGWGRRGHEVVIAVAERHLTEKAKANIAKYIAHDLKKESVWMDEHRRDEDIAYTSAWHVYSTYENHDYDPNPRLYKGDVVHSLKVSEYNLNDYERLTDSAVVFNLRMVLHFVGDLHCPTHSYPHNSNYKWACTLNGKPQKTFHSIYDKMPQWIWKKTKAAEIAEQIDNASKGEIKKIQRGDFHDWAKDCATKSAEIMVWNPIGTETLNPQTVELSRDLVNLQMRNGGYRLAYLLNKYFGK
jgi:hypothetical protein